MKLPVWYWATSLERAFAPRPERATDRDEALQAKGGPSAGSPSQGTARKRNGDKAGAR